RILLAARAVAYIDPTSGGSSGIYLAKLFQSMGIASEIAKKAVLVRGGTAGDRVARGEADIALQQASEIKLVPAIKFAGMLPEPIQNYTIYAGAISADTGALQAATALMAAFSDPSADAILRRPGLEMPSISPTFLGTKCGKTVAGAAGVPSGPAISSARMLRMSVVSARSTALSRCSDASPGQLPWILPPAICGAETIVRPAWP